MTIREDSEALETNYMHVLKPVVQQDNGGLRFDEGKLRYDLFPPEAYEEITRVYTRGAQKYAERNWERGMKWGKCLRALKSHLTKWEKGEVFDDELTDCRHLAMVAWNAIALLTYELRQIGENDIPGQQPKQTSCTSISFYTTT